MLKGGEGGVGRESEEKECGAHEDFMTKGLTARLRGQGAGQLRIVTGGLADWTGGLDWTGLVDWT